jgi:hypothetical protein
MEERLRATREENKFHGEELKKEWEFSVAAYRVKRTARPWERSRSRPA